MENEGEGQSLRSVFQDAERQRKALEKLSSMNAAFQDTMQSAIQLYEQCLRVADQISLFSPNETLEDVATADLVYFLLNYHLAELRMHTSQPDRSASLHRTQGCYEQFLVLLDRYGMLDRKDQDVLERFHASPDTFSLHAGRTSGANQEDVRNAKIRRYKEEKAIKERLHAMEKDNSSIERDDATYRDYQLLNITACQHKSFSALESVAQELHILSMKPPTPPPDSRQQSEDSRDRSRQDKGAYSDRLDSARHLSAGLTGPLLDGSGRPLRPFTLLGSKREEIRAGVFRQGHRLPTMSIDEYLEEERRRGGIIDGGGPQSEVRPEVDEDDMEAADRATMKAREWDEYVEQNPRGSGNTLNRG